MCATTTEPPRTAIAILARAPVAGKVKTRLTPHLTPAAAARLHHWLLQRTVAAARAAAIGPLTLWCEGDPKHPAIAAIAAAGDIELRQQAPGDLGQRMLAAISCATAASARTAAATNSAAAGVIVIGADCPLMNGDHLRQAALALHGAPDETTADAKPGDAARHQHPATQVVITPAQDGGYVLIGMRRPIAAAFCDITWGGPAVMAQTRRRLRAAGFAWRETPTLWDVDRPEDLPRLYALLPEAAQVVAGDDDGG